MSENLLITESSVAVAFGVVFVVYLSASRKQRDQGGTGRGRWLGVCAGLALAALVPLLPPLLFGERWHWLAEISERVGGDPPGSGWTDWGPPGFDFAVAFIATLVSFLVILKSLQPVGRFFHTGGELPLVEDESFRERIAALARGVGVRPPQVRLLGSAGGQLDVAAAAGGLVGPTLVVTDGLLHRLSEEERDGILAHELAHLARGDIWKSLAVLVLVCVLVVLVSGSVSPWVALALLLGSLAPAIKIRGHFQEPACDVRAARVVGFRTMATALDKIHAAHRLEGKGLLSVLVHATQTHPTREVRLAALRRAAPAGVLVDFPVAGPPVQQHRFWARVALVVWLSALATGLWLGRTRGGAWAGVAVIVGTALVPPLLVLAALGRDLLAALRIGLLRIRFPWLLLFTFTTLLCAIAYVTTSHSTRPYFLALLGVSFVAVIVVQLGGRRGRRIIRQMDLAVRSHDFDAALGHYDRLPARARRRPPNRLLRALCLGRVNGVPAAVAEIEVLVHDVPRFRLARVWLAKLSVDPDPERALGVARQLASELPKDPNPPGFEALALRNLGRHEEALAALERSIALDRNHQLHALESSVRLRAGDVEGARRALALATKHAPGDAATLLSTAEVEILSGPATRAREALTDAARSVARSPLAFLEERLARLEDELTQREEATG